MSRRRSTKAHKPQRKRSLQPSTQKTSMQSVPSAAKRWPWMMGGVLVILVIGFALWHSMSSSASTAIPLPPATSPTVFSNSAASTDTSGNTPGWKTVQTFTGPATNGTNQKTQTFQASDNWQVTWSCQGIDGNDEDLDIVIYNPDGSLYNAGANVTCLATQRVSGNAQELKGGTFYLEINSSTPWTVHIQVPD